MTSGARAGKSTPRERQKRWIQLSFPCVGTSFRASAASGLSHSPPGSPVPPGRRVSHLRQNDRTYIYAFPDWEYVSAHVSKASAYSVASRLCTLQCRAAEIPPETDVDASNPRPGAAAGSLSHGQSARSCRTHLKKVRQTFNRTTSVEQSGVHTTTEGPWNGEQDGRRRVQGTLRPHAPPGRASGGRP